MQPRLCEPQLRGFLQFRLEAEEVEKTQTREAEEAGALSMAAGRTGRLLRPPKGTPQHLGVKLGPPGTLRRRPVVQKRREQATS